MGETEEGANPANGADHAPSAPADAPADVTVDVTDRATAARSAARSPARTKHDLRRRIRAERRGRTPQEQADDARALVASVQAVPEVAAARCVALYASMPGEPQTEELRAALRARGVRVILPIVLPDGLMEWADDSGELVAPAGFGGDEPTGPRLGLDGIRAADVVLVPALAVDTLGRRLGQGAGYYDRALPLLDDGVPVVAVVHDGEVLDAAVEPVPDEPHDRRVDAVVTPKGYLRLGG
ncbi:5-formyltetrahydrofolate cyclo-ligase [Kineosporia sp. R_H_3]|uniref:5-formyltetrahydrofolate cyclo-ligase n=1 Tax=Kineosporia sp. R_H_3 TaxID=1961848 RepID=UPI000B4B697D|nr:5-formyltetrahydrofolate cyclo-ligase [Kineosporia sp. R_H_3]